MSTLSTDGSYAVPLSGPDPRLAWLRLLWLKAQGLARTTWAHAQVILSTAVRLPRWAAHTVLSALSSKAGYDTVVSTVATGVRAVARAVRWGLTLLGRGLSWLADTTARLVGRLSPAAERWLRRTAEQVTRPVRDGISRLGELLTGAGTLAEGLARIPVVRSVTTTTAKVAAGVLTVHAISKGAVAAKIVAALPASMDLVIAVTNPWVALAGVAVVALSAMGVALARLLAAGTDQGPDGGGTDAAAGGVAADLEDVGDVLTDLAEIATSVNVVVQADGSVEVQGIPASVPEDLREVVARIAADATITHLHRTLRVRPTPSRDDRRLFTKAAREALLAEAKRRKHRSTQQAA